ncbi:MAG: amidase domain-containing protein [Bacteroidetes bacterium]|nr:amidase domain-containing protein [Bacteroidota bacterium]
MELNICLAVWRQKSQAKASQKVSDLQEIEAVTFATMPTTEIDSETGSPVVSAGFSVFELAIATSGAQWTITNETETTPWTTGIADSLGKEAAEMMAEWHDDEVAEPGLGTVLKVESYNYSGTAAARWAIKYFETSNVSGYYYFPIVGNNGGDCTNFICWCLRHGGWQMTANWHYTGSGSSCNDYSCQRTPSWAGANEFNMYITNRGQYAGVNGNNRVQQLFAGLRVPLKNSWMGVLAPGPNQNFVNEIKKLRVGDIVPNWSWILHNESSV